MQNSVTKHTTCILCGSKKITAYLSLGMMAPANNFLHTKELKKPEKKYPLGMTYCHSCHGSQLTHTIEPKVLFRHYAYFSSTSPMLVSHFIAYAQDLKKQFPHHMGQLVVDVGSNDGVLLKPLQMLGAQVLGVDPAKECADTAIHSGIPTIQKYFSSKLARHIQKQYGSASIITANNVFAHTPDIHDFTRAVRTLLHNEGIFIFEVKYMGDILEKNEFDVIYHEHIFSYLLHPLVLLLAKHGMKIIDVKHMKIHGGSLRVFATHKNSHFRIKRSVQNMLMHEVQKGYTKFSTYKVFAQKPPQTKKKLLKILTSLVQKGNHIAGYGASAKGTTMLQFCKLSPGVIEYIIDSATSKIGTFTPGTHIPVVDPVTLHTNTPDYILIFAWDHKDTILKKEQWFINNGGGYILPTSPPKAFRHSQKI